MMSTVDYCIAWPQRVFINICYNREKASDYRTQILIKTRAHATIAHFQY